MKARKNWKDKNKKLEQKNGRDKNRKKLKKEKKREL